MSRARLIRQERAWAIWLLALSLCTRSLIAPGYMPQALDGGAFLTLCHGGLTAAVAERLFADGHRHHQGAAVQDGHLSGHHHPADDAGSFKVEALTGLSSDELCPLGDGLGSAFLQAFDPSLDRIAPVGPEATRTSALVLAVTLTAFLARGPPRPVLLS